MAWALPGVVHSAPVPLQWVLNPASPCAEDSVVLVFRGYFPIWDQSSSLNPFYVASKDSFARAAASGSGRIVVRTVYRPDRLQNSGDFTGVPIGLGRLASGTQWVTIEHHQLVQLLDGSLDSTVVETPFHFDVAATCNVPTVPMAQLPWVSSASVSEPCPWQPLVLTLHGQFVNSCPRTLLSAGEDSAHAQFVVRPLPNFRNPGCFDFSPPWTSTISLGLPATGNHHIEMDYLEMGYNYRWPPTPPRRFLGVMDVAVPPTCAGLPERAPLPDVTGIGVFAAGSCEATDAPPSGPGIPIAIRGEFPNGCRHVSAVDLLPNPLGSQPPLVRITVADDACEGISCIESNVPWCVETRIPSLPAGLHALLVQVDDVSCEGFGETSAMDAFTFEVPRTLAAAPGGEGTVGVDPESPGAGASWALSEAWPNPSSGRVALRLSTTTAGRLDVAVYDLSGRRVRVLQHGDSKPGSITVTWDGRDATGTPLPDGVYFLRMTLEGKSALRRIVRIRTLD